MIKPHSAAQRLQIPQQLLEFPYQVIVRQVSQRRSNCDGLALLLSHKFQERCVWVEIQMDSHEKHFWKMIKKKKESALDVLNW